MVIFQEHRPLPHGCVSRISKQVTVRCKDVQIPVSITIHEDRAPPDIQYSDQRNARLLADVLKHVGFESILTLEVVPEVE